MLNFKKNKFPQGIKLTDMVAAVDLGSNNFHMIVAQVTDGQLKIVDRLREMVRLAGGLDEHNNLTPEVQQRAYDCLKKFGQRLSGMPSVNVRVVGTNTLRSARNSAALLAAFEEALGHPIEIISGLEEARMIYLGVAHTLADTGAKRLVVDIGGGSTEFIVGERFEPIRMESLYMGCVSYSRRYFPDGAISRKRLKRAEVAARVELEPIEKQFRKLGWQMAIGASGTIQAINKVISAAGWSTEGITLTALKKLVDVLAQVEHVDKLKLDGLNPSRAPIFPGGVMILLSVFEALKVDRMEISDGALREGLLYDLLGRIHHEDVRSRSVTALAARYHIDQEQAKRVSDTARYCLNQIAIAWEIEGEETELLLNWAAELHEIGLDIAHSHYHKHGAYVVEHADLYGFSRQEQKMISTLIRVHRRKFPETVFKTLPQDLVQPIQRLAILVRLGVLLHRSRSEEPLPLFTIQARKKEIDLEFPDGWLDQHALTQADLEQEAIYLLGAGFTLTYC